MNTIDYFLQRKPHEVFTGSFDDGTNRVVFAGRWYIEEFESDAVFVQFLECYDCVLQAALHGFSDERIRGWYVKNSASDNALTSVDWVDLDASLFLGSVGLGFAAIPWLSDRDHAMTCQLPGNDFPELVGKGQAGYVYIFVADSLE